MSLEEIVRFASEFDPQPFHIDPEAARTSFFGTLVASGWHCAALTMQLLVKSDFTLAGGIIGAGAEIKWPEALRPGDEIHLEVQIVAKRLLRSRSDVGLVTTNTKTINQNGVVVQEFAANLFVAIRDEQSSDAVD